MSTRVLSVGWSRGQPTSRAAAAAKHGTAWSRSPGRARIGARRPPRLMHRFTASSGAKRRFRVVRDRQRRRQLARAKWERQQQRRAGQGSTQPRASDRRRRFVIGVIGGVVWLVVRARRTTTTRRRRRRHRHASRPAIATEPTTPDDGTEAGAPLRPTSRSTTASRRQSESDAGTVNQGRTHDREHTDSDASTDDGTVYVVTAEGERVVGQWPDGDPPGSARLLPQAV